MTRRKRLFSAFLDHCFVSLIGVPVWMFIDWLLPTHWLGITVAAFMYANKDLLQGRSPAKRILGLGVTKHQHTSTASPVQCFVRNLTIVLWPIEVAMLLINPARRLGDYMAGTECQEIEN